MKEITQAFVLGAGLGVRLRPLTDDLPKPLVPIFQKRLITFALDHLISAGVKSFVVNTHRMPGKFTEFFRDEKYREYRVCLLHEPVLLETGGGIKNAEPYLNSGPFLTYSGDLLTDVSLELLVEEHFRQKNDVTLALRETGLASEIAFREGRVVDIGNRQGVPGNYDFANIAVWSTGIFNRIPAHKKISFIPVLGEWIGQTGRIGGVVVNDGKWFNIGSRAEYLEVHRVISAENWRPHHVSDPDWFKPVGPDAQVASDAQLRGCSVVASGCRVGEGAVLEDTILWTGAQIASRSRLSRCIVRSHRSVAGNYHDVDI